MASHYSSFEPKGTRWLVQRLTAAFLVVVLAFHFMLLHFVNQGLDGTQKSAVKWVLIVAGILLIVQGIRVAFAMTGIQSP